MNDKEAYMKLSEKLFQGIYLDQLTLSAKVVYAFLYKRMKLSVKNNFTDKNGRICLIVPKKAINKKLGFCMATITNAYSGLKKVGLMETKRQGQGKPNIIYLKDISEIVFSNNDLSKENGEFCSKIDIPAENNINSVKNKNKNDFFEKSIPFVNYDKYKKIIKENIAYEKFKVDNDNVKLVDEIIELMADIICSTAKEVKIGQSWYSKEVVRSKFLKLRYLDISSVIENITKHPYKIKNMRQYLITCLFNSNTNSEIALKNQVFSDMWQEFSSPQKSGNAYIKRTSFINYPQPEYSFEELKELEYQILKERSSDDDDINSKIIEALEKKDIEKYKLLKEERRKKSF